MREETNDAKARNEAKYEEEKVEQFSAAAAKDEPEPAKEVIDQWTANIESAKRLENEFRDQFQKYGDGLSKWLSDMSLCSSRYVCSTKSLFQ